MFKNDTEMNSTVMRQEEKRILENLFSSPLDNKSGNIHPFSRVGAHEYITLCRGKSLVSFDLITLSAI